MQRKIWDKHEIKAEIHRRGYTLQRIAEEAEIEVSACWVALNRHHRAGELAIAKFLGRRLSILWPDRYPPSASRVASNDAGDGGASQKAAAA